MGLPNSIIYREDGKILAVEDTDLPVKLPEIENFNESSTALNDIKSWKETICPKTGMRATRETDTFDILNHLGIILDIVMPDWKSLLMSKI